MLLDKEFKKDNIQICNQDKNILHGHNYINKNINNISKVILGRIVTELNNSRGQFNR